MKTTKKNLFTDLVRTLRRAGEVERYHTVGTLRRDTVGTHSHNVAILCYILSEGEPSKDLLMAALLHDIPEVQYGDIPGDMKRVMPEEHLDHLHAAERSFLDELHYNYVFGSHFDSLTILEKHILKLSDLFEGLLFCAVERSMGNQSIEFVFRNYSNYILDHINKYTLAHGRRAIDEEMYNSINTIWEEAHYAR